MRLVVCMLFAFKSTLAEGETVLRRVHESRPSNPVVEVFCHPTTVVGAQEFQKLPKPYQLRLAVDSVWLGNDIDVAAVTEKMAVNVPTPESTTFWSPTYPASRRSTNGSMLATSLMSDHYFAAYIGWDEEDDDEKHSAWLREHMLEIEKQSDGTFLADADPQLRPARHWSVDAGQRLMSIRKKWDPAGIICGYLDAGDKSGVNGLSNKFSWET